MALPATYIQVCDEDAGLLVGLLLAGSVPLRIVISVPLTRGVVPPQLLQPHPQLMSDLLFLKSMLVMHPILPLWSGVFQFDI